MPACPKRIARSPGHPCTTTMISLGAEKEFERAIELNPRYTPAHHWFGMFLAMMGRHEEGYTELQRAIRLDPHWSFVRWGQGFVHWCGRQYDRAIAECHEAIELDPYFPQGYVWLGLTSVAKCLYEPGIAALEKGVELSERAPVAVAFLGEAYAAAGSLDEAQKILNELKGKSHVTAYLISRIYAALGNKSETFKWLEIAYQGHAEWITLLKVDPRFDTLRDDARFQDLMGLMNFPEGG